MRNVDKIYVAGHTGMVGSAIVRKLKEHGFHNLILKTSQELDLRDQVAVADFFAQEKPDYVFLAAAKVGGIVANNTYRAEFLYNNLAIQNNVIHQSYVHKVKKLLFLGSSCLYPKLSPQPIKEEYLLTGQLEPTNEAYAIAKIAGIKMCQMYRHQYGCNFIVAMPTNLYGPNDNYDLQNSHVLPALLRKLHEAKLENSPFVEVWGTGKVRREFLHVEDLAEALLLLMFKYHGADIINIGMGEDISIQELALLLKETTGFEGKLFFDFSKPDGTPKKLLDSSRIQSLGFRPKITLKEGIQMVYKEYQEKRRILDLIPVN